MTMLIHCPNCQTALNVPQGAAGRPARCPSCKNKFTIPKPTDIMEETIAAWLVSDFMGKNEQEEREDDDELLKELADLEDIQEDTSTPASDQIISQTSTSGRRTLEVDVPAKSTKIAVDTTTSVQVTRIANPGSDAPASTQSRTSSPVAPSTSSTTHEVAAGTSPAIAPATASAATPAPQNAAPLPSFYSTQPKVPGNQANAPTPSTEPVSKPVETLSAAPTTATPTVPVSPASGDASGLNIPSPEAAQSASAASTTPAVPIPTVVITMPPDPRKAARPVEASSSIFPTELTITGPRPHLAVLEINQSGVRFAFDSIWLEQHAFRSSMPIRGAFGGNNNRADLRARPMVWADRSGAVIRSVVDVETRYEQPLLPDWIHRDIINAMGIIEGLPRPFCNPMPYFVDKSHLNLSLSCCTFKRPDGGLTCEVLIASGDVALEWLRNVNGTCGPEYEALERELQIIHSDRWALLPEQVRQRVAVWCRFQTRERFMLYLNDAEMASRDAGLAGLVITDRRMVYHKFHHNGQVDLSSPGTLLLKKLDDFIQLYYEGWNMPGHRVKLVKLKPEDANNLAANLAEYPTLQIQHSGA